MGVGQQRERGLRVQDCLQVGFQRQTDNHLDSVSLADWEAGLQASRLPNQNRGYGVRWGSAEALSSLCWSLSAQRAGKRATVSKMRLRCAVARRRTTSTTRYNPELASAPIVAVGSLVDYQASPRIICTTIQRPTMMPASRIIVPVVDTYFLEHQNSAGKAGCRRQFGVYTIEAPRLEANTCG